MFWCALIRLHLGKLKVTRESMVGTLRKNMFIIKFLLPYILLVLSFLLIDFSVMK